MMNPLYVLAGVATLVSCSMIANSSPKPMSGAAQQGGETIVRTNIAKRNGVNITGLYNDTCAKCHGVNGEGGGGGTKSLLTVDKFHQKWDRAFFDATRNGVPDAGMEGYGATMSDEEIWGLIVHIRELQNKAIRPQTAPKGNGDNYTSSLHNYKMETVVDNTQGLKVPWSIDWLPDGKMLVTNRPGFMSVVVGNKVVGQVSGLPKSVEQGQGGLMEVAVHPTNGWIYLSVADPSPKGAMTKIVRGKISWNGNEGTWGSEQTLFKVAEDLYTRAGVHFGSKIAFDGKGHVFFSCGERGQGMLAQDLTRPNGKVYRINEDGSVPKDNPFIGKGGVADMVWSYGHRNPQGLTITPDGQLWDTEHAPRGGDELNLVQKGANYGWEVSSFGINYNDSAHSVPWPTKEQDFKLPVFRWLPSIGASGLDVAKGTEFPKWNGDLLAGGLSGANLDRIRVKDGKLVEVETLLLWKGRVRDVAVAKDGKIYVALNGPDIIVRLVAK